jgi:hypothetical protein
MGTVALSEVKLPKSFFASIRRMGRINSKIIFFGLYPENPEYPCHSLPLLSFLSPNFFLFLFFVI